MMKMQIKYLLDRTIDIQNDPLVGVVMATTLIENLKKKFNQKLL